MNKLLTLFGLLLILQSCTEEKAGWWKNDQIKASKREDLHELKARVIQDIKDDDMKHLEYIMSKELIEDKVNAQRQVDHIGNYLKTNDYTISDEYYVVNKWKESDTIKTNNYNLIYGGVAHEMYFAFLLPKKGVNQWMITLVFGKFDYGWRLSTLDVEPYIINHKTAPELYKLAQDQYKKNYYSNAATNMQLSGLCLRPNDFWQYQGDSLIYKFEHVALDDANKHLTIPCIVNQVPTHPRIFRITNEKTQYGTFPMIYYQTSINIKDINGLKKEQQAMKKVIGKVIPGIDQDNDYLFYTAFNKMPNNRESVDRYEIDDKLK